MLVLFSVIKSTMNQTGARIKSAIHQSVVLVVHLGALVGLSLAKKTMLLPLNTHLDTQSSATGDRASHRALRWTISPLTDGNIVTLSLRKPYNQYISLSAKQACLLRKI